MIATVDPARAEEVAPPLLAYLRQRLGVATLTFAEEPQALGRGFASFIYAFRLSGEAPAPWDGPLVARILLSLGEGAVMERETAVQRFVVGRGYPALEPLAIDPDGKALGLPLMILPRIEGGTMFERITRNPLAAPRLLASMGRAQAALHRMPIEGCPLPYDAPLVERRLREWRRDMPAVREQDAPRALAWLEEHASVVAQEDPAICHNDFHPLNILMREDGGLVVIDWTDAGLGDRHHDVGRSVALLWIAQIAAHSRLERLILLAARGFMRRRFTAAYARELPLEPRRMVYWEAAHVFYGWMQLASLRDRGADAPESKLETVQNIPPETMAQLRSYFWRLTERL